VGDLVAVVVAVALLVEQGLQLLHAVLTRGIQAEQIPYHGCLGLADDQPLILLLVAEDAAVAQHHVGFDGLLMPEFDTRGQLAKLVLGDGGHDGEAKLGALVQSIDVVVLEEYAHVVAQKLSRVLEGVQRVTGETGDLLGDDEIKGPVLGVRDHLVEVLAFLGRDARKPFVHVAGNKSLRAVLLDEILVVGNLVVQRVELLVGFGGNSGVERDPQGNIVDGFGFQL